MPSSTGYVRAAPGIRCPATFPLLEDRVYDFFRRWRLAGGWLRLHGRPRSLCRHAGRAARPSRRPPSSTARAPRPLRAAGCTAMKGAKKINGRKRHLLVDSSGLVFCAQVHAADLLADRDGACPRLVAAGGTLRQAQAPVGGCGRPWPTGSLDQRAPGLGRGSGPATPPLGTLPRRASNRRPCPRLPSSRGVGWSERTFGRLAGQRSAAEQRLRGPACHGGKSHLSSHAPTHAAPTLPPGKMTTKSHFPDAL